MDHLARLGAKHLEGVLRTALEHPRDGRALVVYDRGCELSRALTEAYVHCLPGAAFLDFEQAGKAAVHGAFDELAPGDLVVLIQSTSFRLDQFRIRVELFRRRLKVIEHPHLERMGGPEAARYMESLAYDPAYYRGVGQALKARLDRAQEVRILAGGMVLRYRGGLESAKLNVGDYRGMDNIGGQYPIGEVFTEARDLAAVSGTAVVVSFGDRDFRVNQPAQPIHMHVEGGQVVRVEGSTPEFDGVLAAIRADETHVALRELGFGLNRAFGHARPVSDVGTFERMCGVHLSLGQKHAVYPKATVDRRRARHHVDVFLRADQVAVDGEVVFEGDRYGPLERAALRPEAAR